jgi:hypothetical protein
VIVAPSEPISSCGAARPDSVTTVDPAVENPCHVLPSDYAAATGTSASRARSERLEAASTRARLGRAARARPRPASTTAMLLASSHSSRAVAVGLASGADAASSWSATGARALPVRARDTCRADQTRERRRGRRGRVQASNRGHRQRHRARRARAAPARTALTDSPRAVQIALRDATCCRGLPFGRRFRHGETSWPIRSTHNPRRSS